MNELSTIKSMVRKASTPRVLQYKGRSSAGISLKGQELHELAEAMLKKLQESNYTCFYTGMKIELKNSASIDHIFPSSKNEDKQYTLDNLVWCHIAINRMKNDMHPQAFYDLMMQMVSAQEYLKNNTQLQQILSK